jgi:hypothetical protein
MYIVNTSHLAGKLEDFEFRATYTIVQHLQLFEKNPKNPKEIQNILQKIQNGGIKF